MLKIIVQIFITFCSNPDRHLFFFFGTSNSCRQLVVNNDDSQITFLFSPRKKRKKKKEERGEFNRKTSAKNEIKFFPGHILSSFRRPLRRLPDAENRRWFFPMASSSFQSNLCLVVRRFNERGTLMRPI